MAGMSSRLVLAVLAVAVAVAGVLALGAAHATTGRATPHTIYCQKGDGLPVGFLTGNGLGTSCPPGFRLARRQADGSGSLSG